MKEPINILCATDDNYVPYMGIMLTSLFENNKDEDIHVYVLAGSLSNINIQDLYQLSSKYKYSINIININRDLVKDFPLVSHNHISLAAYYRLFAADLLPQNIERIIYLDCDIIVDGSLLPMWKTNLGDSVIAAVKDFENHAQRLKYPEENNYYNSGVLLINLKKWRELGITKKCLKVIETRADELYQNDQDVINIVFNGNIVDLAVCYNMLTLFLLSHTQTIFTQDLRDDINKYCLSPIIIHFVWINKPWQEGSRHPYAPYFLYYKSISLWKDLPLIKSKRSLWKRFIQFRNEIIWRLGIMKRPVSYIIPVQYHPNDKKRK